MEILSDFLTAPIYDGRGRWAQILEVLRDLKRKELSGILLLRSSNVKVFNFVEYGEIVDSVLFEEDSMFAYEGDDFFKEQSAKRQIKPYRYSFSPLNGDVVMVVSTFHRSSLIMDTITPYPMKVVDELSNIEFSGILRCISPLSFSSVFIEGLHAGTFSKGESFPLSDLLSAEGGLYEFKVFNVKDQLFEKSYEYLFRRLYRKVLEIYSTLNRHIKDFPLELRKHMLNRSYADPILDPIIGLVDPRENTLIINASKRRGIYILESLLDVIEDTLKEHRSVRIPKGIKDMIKEVRREIREGI